MLLLALCGGAAAIAGHGTRPPNAIPTAVDYGTTLRSDDNAGAPKRSIHRRPNFPTAATAAAAAAAAIAEQPTHRHREHRLRLDRRAYPVGFDTGPASTAAQFTAAAATVSDEARQGMNMVMLYHSVQTGHTAAEMAEIRGFLDRCADLGVAVAYDLSKLVQASTRRSNPVPRMKEALEQEVRAVMTHPAIVNGGLFYLSDEPDGQDLDPVAFHGAYRLVKATAPGVPVAICLCDVPPNWASHLWPHYTNSTDISESPILLELTTIA